MLQDTETEHPVASTVPLKLYTHIWNLPYFRKLRYFFSAPVVVFAYSMVSLFLQLCPVIGLESSVTFMYFMNSNSFFYWIYSFGWFVDSVERTVDNNHIIHFTVECWNCFYDIQHNLFLSWIAS